MTREQYILLYEKYLAGEATPEDAAKVLSYQDEFEMYIPAEAEYLDEANIETGNRILNRLNQSTGNRQVPKIPIRRWLLAAAAVLIISVSGILFLKNKQAVNTSTNLLAAKQDVAPGSNKATLTLANGKVISLNDVANGTITKQGNITIKKKKDGMLEYIVSPAVADNTSVPSINTIATPRGGQYQLILPDGTLVYLNAASELRYPVAFTGTERKVELTGEAYFEVTKNKAMPFIVHTAKGDIQVLGTHFNIMAYADDPNMKTTLLEGSVKISQPAKNITKMLKPDQEAVLSDIGIRVTDVNAEDAVAWKDGIFLFNDDRLDEIMKKVSRWYNVDVEFNNETLKRETYSGTVSRFARVSQVLKKLEALGGVSFRIEPHTIIVMRK